MLSWAGLPLSFGLGLARKDPLIVVGALRRNTSLAMQRNLGLEIETWKGASQNSVPCFHREPFSRVPVHRTFTLYCPESPGIHHNVPQGKDKGGCDIGGFRRFPHQQNMPRASGENVLLEKPAAQMLWLWRAPMGGNFKAQSLRRNA